MLKDTQSGSRKCQIHRSSPEVIAHPRFLLHPLGLGILRSPISRGALRLILLFTLSLSALGLASQTVRISVVPSCFKLSTPQGAELRELAGQTGQNEFYLPPHAATYFISAEGYIPAPVRIDPRYDRVIRVRLEPLGRTAQRMAELAAGPVVGALAYEGKSGSLFVARWSGSRIDVFQIESDGRFRQSAPIEIPSGQLARSGRGVIAVVRGELWLAQTQSSSVLVFDAATRKFLRAIPLALSFPQQILVDDDRNRVLIRDDAEKSIATIDIATHQVGPALQLQDFSSEIVVFDGSVLVAYRHLHQLLVFEPGKLVGRSMVCEAPGLHELTGIPGTQRLFALDGESKLVEVELQPAVAPLRKIDGARTKFIGLDYRRGFLYLLGGPNEYEGQGEIRALDIHSLDKVSTAFLENFPSTVLFADSFFVGADLTSSSLKVFRFADAAPALFKATPLSPDSHENQYAVTAPRSALPASSEPKPLAKQ